MTEVYLDGQVEAAPSFSFFNIYLAASGLVARGLCSRGTQALEYAGSVVAACGLSSPMSCEILVP